MTIEQRAIFFPEHIVCKIGIATVAVGQSIKRESRHAINNPLHTPYEHFPIFKRSFNDNWTKPLHESTFLACHAKSSPKGLEP